MKREQENSNQINEQEERPEVEQDKHSERKDFTEFMNNISTEIASTFNKLIYTVNRARKNLERTQDENNKGKRRVKKEAELIDLVKLQQDDKTLIKKLKDSRKVREEDQKPKKPISSFFVFYKEKHLEWKSKKGEPGFIIAKQIAEAWKQLSDEEKRPYNQKANQTRQKYKEDMRDYLEIHSHEIQAAKIQKRKIDKIKRENGEADSQLNQEAIKGKLKGVSLKQMRDEKRKEYSHRPKAPVSSFFVFYRRNTQIIAQNYQQHQGKKLSRIASRIWKQMPLQQRNQYEEQAQRQRQKYHEKMREYRQKYPEEIINRKNKISDNMRRNPPGNDRKIKKSKDDSSDGSIPSEELDESKSYESVVQKGPVSNKKKEKHKTEKKDNNLLPHKPKGSVGSYFHFYQQNMYKLMNPGEKTPGSEIAKKASAKWKQMSQAEREPYHKMARIDHVRYHREIQQYRVKYPEEYIIFMKNISNKSLKNLNRDIPSQTKIQVAHETIKNEQVRSQLSPSSSIDSNLEININQDSLTQELKEK